MLFDALLLTDDGYFVSEAPRQNIVVDDSCHSFQTTIIPGEDDIDFDVFAAMTSLGCFKDRPRLIEALLNSK
jgi:hypothetical protein